MALGYTRSVHEAARRSALDHVNRYFDRADSSVFRFRRFDLARVVAGGDPAENAWAHLVEFGVDRPDDWRQRDDFRHLPPAVQEELELWLAEQSLRFAHAVESRPSADEWRRALTVVDHVRAALPMAPLDAERLKLARRIDPRAARPAQAASPGTTWREQYLLGVEDELDQRPPEAERAHYDAVLRQRPNSFWGHYRAATVAYRLRDYNAVAEHLSLCINERPRNPALRVQLAGCLYELGRFDDALLACNKALQLDRDQPEPYLSRSFIRQRMGQHEGREEDIREYERLSRLHGKESLGQRRLVRFWPHHFDSTGQREGWDDDLPQRILAVDPDDLDAHIALASQLMETGRPKKAMHEFDEILRLEPDHIWALLSRALIGFKHQYTDGVACDLDRFLNHPRLGEFLRECPENHRQALTAFHLRAWIHQSRSRLPEATGVALSGLALAEQLGLMQAESHYTLARIYGEEARSQPERLRDACLHLCDALTYPCSYDVNERFEIDFAFGGEHVVLRPWLCANRPWAAPSTQGP
jgi:tetratricopeptide (TPR) repeat protein